MVETFKLIHPRTLVARRARIVATVGLVLVSLSLTAPRPRAAYGVPQEYAQKLNRLVQESGSTPAMKVFAEGRDFLDNNEWAKAADRFQSFIKSYPNDKDVDAAYYWLAYTLNKQGRKQEAKSWLDKLFREFPKSGWRDEATALNVELGDPQAVKRGIEDKENDEIKLIALQSLLDNNPERAMQYISEMLKPGATTSPQMREMIVAVLGSHGGRQAVPVLLQLARTDPSPRVRLTAIHRLGEEGGEAVLNDLMSIYQADRDVQVKQQVLHALSEMEGAAARAKLVEVARNQSENQQLRLAAIHWLGEREDSAFADLSQIYDAEQTTQIRSQILHSFSEMDDPRARQKLIEVARAGGRQGDEQALREYAIHWLGERDDDATVDELMRIYDAEPATSRTKVMILHSFSEMKNARARAKLLEVARASGAGMELRSAAIRWLIDEGDTPQTVDLLVGLYDAEKNDQLRSSILHSLSESKQKAALRKLMDVARRDPSMGLRKMAIHWIGESKDPEALRFLEEILRQP